MMNYKWNNVIKSGAILSAIFAGFSLISVPRAKAADIQSYRLLFYPTAGQPCEGIAAEMGTRLRDAAGVRIYSTTCEANGNDTANLEINYIAAEQLTITSTNAKRLMEIPNSMYKDAEDCQAGLSAEVAAFEENLGLKALVAYCYAAPGSMIYPFAVRVDAVGTAKNGMRVIDDMELTFSPVLGDTDILGSVLTERLRERGVKVVRSVVGMEDSMSEYWAGARYYANASLLLKLNEVSTFRSEAACIADAETLQRILENGNVPPLSVFCSRDSMLGVARLHYMMIPGDYASELAPDKFADRDACLNGKAAVEEIYRTDLGRAVIGSLCVYSTDLLRGTIGLQIFSNP